ncbi:Prominin [Dirofilaria immitis]|nr:Prominin [Dirofilaria immitis]
MFTELHRQYFIIIISSFIIVIYGNNEETTLVEDIQSEQCLKKTIEIDTISYSYGISDMFYDIAQKLCQSMQAELNDAYFEKLISLLTGERSEDLIVSVNIIFRRQFWAHLLPKIGLALVLLLPICGFLLLYCQYGNKKRKNTKLFEALSFGCLVALIGVQFVMIGSLILSIESIEHIFNNANDTCELFKNTNKDLINVTEIICDGMKCEMEIRLQILFDKIKYDLQQLLSNTFNHYEERNGYMNMQSVINNLENISWKLNTAAVCSDKLACNIRDLPLPLQTKIENLTAMTNNITNYAYQINENLISADAILQKINVEKVRDEAVNMFENINFKKYFPEDLFDQLKEDSEQLKKLSIELNNFTVPDDIVAVNESLRDNFNCMNSSVSNLINVMNYTVSNAEEIIEQYVYSGEIINEIAQIIAEESNYTIDNITKYIYDSMIYFRENSYNCRPLYNIWENIGLTTSQKLVHHFKNLLKDAITIDTTTDAYQ